LVRSVAEALGHFSLARSDDRAGRGINRLDEAKIAADAKTETYAR